jgi:hypothetical protein
MPMMLVMVVFMLMFKCFVLVFMGMMFREVEPYTQTHQPRCNPKSQRYGFWKYQ